MRTAFREDPADPALEGNAVEAADAGVDSDDDDVEGNPEPDTTAEFEVAIALVRPGEPTAPTTPPLDGEPRKADKLMLNVKVSTPPLPVLTPSSEDAVPLAPSTALPLFNVGLPLYPVAVVIAVAVAPKLSDVTAVAALHNPNVFCAQHAAFPSPSAPQ
ncbi:hypothetical protein LTS18_014609 [Coniosporium uncinatum]|uniref:Uncharacterized protein n=1 Tax=Coniosporium uncinatum TaxID=93489 RepID=A0ACC3DV11_9PEZI|nr:hypothetical protein LTS18_014609 [Coniosporium uncinatum]